ncbi:MAG: YbhB/YbcL family Raf kinase inhibitor-like protein [Melioribacter sp.]|nr:YbhB/YbcL family Raf kinase inhibitor-like protein [Melioribacter sp.]
MGFKIHSSAFNDGDFIPSKYTCDGENISPPLNWTNIPTGTKSLALINDDPDAPVGDWVHWILYNIPPEIMKLEEAASNKGKIPKGSLEGLNDWGRIGYGGPCPPSGVHRYFFKLYALDCLLSLKQGATKKELLKAMNGHILATSQLVGKYQRKR